MKKSIYYLMMMVVTLSMLSVLNACGDDDDKNPYNNDAIVGTWVDDEGYELTFKADGTLLFYDADDDELERGRYSINWKTNIIEFLFWDNYEQEWEVDETWKIVSLTKNKLILEHTYYAGEYWTLIRAN